MERIWLMAGAILGATSVMVGAFGAHGLKNKVPADLLAVFETGAKYQMYHALALVLVGVLWARYAGTSLSLAGWSFLFGTLVFSGSLYVLTLTGLRWLGAITPIGGVALILGWIALAVAVSSSTQS